MVHAEEAADAGDVIGLFEGAVVCFHLLRVRLGQQACVRAGAYYEGDLRVFAQPGKHDTHRHAGTTQLPEMAFYQHWRARIQARRCLSMKWTARWFRFRLCSSIALESAETVSPLTIVGGECCKAIHWFGYSSSSSS